MAIPALLRFHGVSRWRRHAPVVLLAIPLAIALCACSFDLGSFSSEPAKETPKAAPGPSADLSARSVSDAQGYAAKGHALARSGKTEEALAEFDHALALDPYNTQALYGRGLLYQGERQHQRAIEDLTAAHGLMPQRAEPLVGRANSYLALDKIKEAAADLDEAVEADPQNAQAWSSRGLAYERLGDKTKAASSYGHAITIRPKDDAARSGLTRVGG